MNPTIPEYTRLEILAYVHRRVPPSGFLYAVLSNDLREAFGRADETNAEAMKAIVSFCYCKIPADCWGSRDRVRDWLARLPEPPEGKK